ncbi:MAG: BatA domain-containing protein [Planctomycetaceae bacterium]|jgi:hypothetical protein|nr:BatA domain-containing protein [Planctomycetaceae bacterium]
MSFITFSLFLGGVIFAVVPVVLHLLMRGKPKRVEFPALVFIKKNLEVNRRSYRVKHILLLLLRTIVILLFGLALSRPSLKYVDWLARLSDFLGGSKSADARGNDNDYDFRGDDDWAGLGMQDAPVAAAIVVDSSLRMNYVAGNQSRLDVAKQFAHWILKRIPAKSEIAVLSTSRESAAFQVDLLAARDKIERVQTIPSGRAIVDVTSDAINLLAGSQNAQRELYILTDLSEAGWSDKVAETLAKHVSNLRGQKNQQNNAADKNTNTNQNDNSKTTTQQQSIFGNDKWLEIFIIDVGVSSPADTAIVKMKVMPQVVSPDAAVEIEVEVSNIGGETSRTIDLVLSGESDANETIRDTKTISFPDGESQRSISFSVAGFGSGIHQGKVQFTVPDLLEFDDKMYFTVQVLPPPRVMIVSDVPVRDTSLFLRQALMTIPFEVEAISFFELSGKTASELNQFKAVILLDPVLLDVVVWKKLADFASTGGGVGIFLGANATITSFDDPTVSEIIGAKLVRHARSPDMGLWILPLNKSTPVLTPFKQYGELERFPWDTQMVFRYWELGELSVRADVALSFTDGRPAIITQTLGHGRTVTITTPVSETNDVTNRWNVLPNNDASWMFVLLMEGIAKYLAGSAEQRFIFNVGEPIVIRPAVDKMPETALLGMPDGKSIRLTPNITQKEINIPATTEMGNFRIRSGGSQGALDTGFSTNYNGNETILHKIDKEQLDRFFGENNYHLVRTPQEIDQKISRRRIGMELYSIILLLLAAFFVTEFIFASRFREKRKGTSKNHF